MDQETHEMHSHDYKCKDQTSRNLGTVGTVLGGAALLGQMNCGRGIFGLFGGNGCGCNNGCGYGNGTGTVVVESSAPSAFQAWARSCDDAIALTNEIWRLQLSSERERYADREVDTQEKFGIYKSQVDGDFSLFKGYSDAIAGLTAKHNADVFALYKAGRDQNDVISARLCELEKKVAVSEAVRPYQDKLLQEHIDNAYAGAINYTDRRTCRMIEGQVVLPSTPTVTGYGSYCCCPSTSSASAAAMAAKAATK